MHIIVIYFNPIELFFYEVHFVRLKMYVYVLHLPSVFNILPWNMDVEIAKHILLNFSKPMQTCIALIE